MKTTLSLNNQIVVIDSGELVSYCVDAHEFIHQKGSPGWGSADTEMFPIIGPVNEADFRVSTPKGKAIQDQHGLLRQFSYQLVAKSELMVTYKKEYKANTEITNSKYPEKSTEPILAWPYAFVFEKQFELNNDGLEIRFIVSGEVGMPFMLGYHPAFKLHTNNPTIVTGTDEIRLEQILAVGNRAFEVPDHNRLILNDTKQLIIETEGFGHFMCWTEVDNMVCIEPITFYPYAVRQNNLHSGFQPLNKSTNFRVLLSPYD